MNAVNALIEAGTDLNAKDNQGKTALIYAFETRNKAFARALIEAGAGMSNAKDRDGESILDWARSPDGPRLILH